MTFLLTAFFSSAFVLFLCYYYFFKKNGNCPPEPRGVPMMGYLPFMRTDYYKQFAEMSKTYGNIFQMQLGRRKVLVLNDWKSINEALLVQSELFSGRDNSIIFRATTHFKDVVTQDSNDIWKQQRKFMLSNFRNFGNGKSENAVEEEAEKLVNKLDESSGKVIEPSEMFFLPLANVTWHLHAGEKFAYGSSKIQRLIEMLHFNFLQFEAGNIVNFIPILRFVSKSFQRVVDISAKIDKFLDDTIKEHKLTYNQGDEPRNFIDSYLREMHKHNDKEKAGQETHPFNNTRLIGSLYSVFNAGIETSSNTLSWAVLYLTLWPEFQDKIQSELDATIGRSRMPCYADRHILHYTHAALLEVQRYSSIVPLAIPHKTKSATKLCGFDIPGQMTVWPNLWAVHHDPDLWGDPDVFRPERFLDPQGKVNKPEYLIPFSIGARACIGESLAKLEMFVFFATVMQQFRFRFPSGVPPPSLEPIVGITLRPKPFPLIIERRM